MSLRLYDTMARAKRTFVPIDPARVTLYVCGPTVYNYAHIGNARPVVVFDVLFRLLRRLYGGDHVLYAANVTDVDDKINLKAAQEGVPIDVITTSPWRRSARRTSSASRNNIRGWTIMRCSRASLGYDNRAGNAR